MKKNSFYKFLIKKDKKLELTPDQGKGSIPYKCPNSSEKSKTPEKGLADKGDSSLKIKDEQPTTSKLNPVKSKFSKYISENCGCESLKDSSEISYGSLNPPEVIKFITVSSRKDDNILTDLIKELKDNNLIEPLLRKILSDECGYDALTNYFGDEEEGESRSDSFVKQMNKSYQNSLSKKDIWDESVSPPIGYDEEPNNDKDDDDSDEGFDLDDDSDEDDYSKYKKHFDDLENDGNDDSDLDDDKDDDSDDNDYSKYKKHFDDLEKPKIQKRFAHQNLLKSMSGYDHMTKT